MDDDVRFVRFWQDEDVVDGANAELLKGREAAVAAAHGR
jgi:hypothetical protein